MRNIFLSAAAAAALLSFGYGAHAYPTAPAAAGYGNPGMILVEDRCGIGWHRAPDGRCRPDRERVIIAPGAPVVVEPPVALVPPIVVEPRGCPLGSHWSERFRRCIVN